MTHWLFPDLLNDSAIFVKAQRYWATLWAEVQGTLQAEASWSTPWMLNPCPDGNPIFTAVCRSLRRGVRIIHEGPPDAAEPDLDWWLDYFGDKKDPDAIHELVIACCPSAENTPRIKQLLKQWIQFGKLTLRRPKAAS
jgi:hypothetical protein